MRSLKSCFLVGAFVLAATTHSAVSVKVMPSMAPNAFGSPNWDPYIAVAMPQLEQDLGNSGNPYVDPTAYGIVSEIPPAHLLVTGFSSWYAQASPGGVLAGEYGNRLHFGLHIVSATTKFRLANLTFAMHSTDAFDSMVFTGDFIGFGYSYRRIGIDYVDGIKGNGDDIVYAAGESETLPVNELIYIGVGNAFAAYVADPGTTLQDKVNWAVNGIENLGPFDVTTTYTIVDDASVTTVGRATVHVKGEGLPVDLNGHYSSPSQVGVTPGTAFASTSTNSDRVVESSAATLAPDSTYTPYSDATKPPKSVALDMRGKSYEFDVDMHSLALWADVIGITPQEFFVVGLGSGAGVPGDERAWVICWKGPADVNGNTFKVELQTDFGISAGVWYDAFSDETKFHVRATVNSANNQMTATVTPLDGIRAGRPHEIGPLALSAIPDDVSNAYLYSGFYSTALKSTAKATMSKLQTDAGSNWEYLFSDDPYVKLPEPIYYRMGMANLSEPVYGFQGFLQTINANQLFGSGIYTSMPFGVPLTAITGAGDLSSGVDFSFGFLPVQVGADLANLTFATNAVENATGLSFRPNSGSPAFLPNQFAGASGAVLANTYNSNLVVVDSTAPTLTGLAATQGVTNVLNGANPVIQGNLHLSVNAQDLMPGSGLSGNPTISIDFPSGPDVVNAPMYAAAGNQFAYDYAITSSTPCGTASISINVSDDAGNNAVPVTGTLNVNIATVTLTIVLDGSDNNLPGTVTRGMIIKLGGNPSAGGNAPYYTNKNVVFSDPDGAGALRLTGTALMTAMDGVLCGKQLNAASVKDPKHSLRKLVSLSGAGDQYTAIVHLKGGDATNDNLIDILDFGVFAAQYGASPGANTLLGYVGNHSDFSGNGIVGTPDFTFFTGGAFLSVGDNEPGNYSDGGGDEPMSTCTIAQMVKAGVPMKIAKAYDLNHDGWITFEEIQKWLNGNGGGR